MRVWLQVSLSAEEISAESVVGEEGFHLKLRHCLIMCILCVVQKWSRRAIGMLPWLVIPFIVLWALSQLFPPDLRFEITSPRLACVVVLLGTIFWYEILLPHLSVYRARRCARIREQQLNFAIELQKLRKTATRRCRNCLTPYRDQKPGGGKFMCSYCGHVSRRPILDIPGPPGRSGIFGNLIRKSGWFFNLDCPAWDGHANRHWAKSAQETSSEEETFSIFIWKPLSSVFSLLMKFCRKALKLGSPGEDGSLDREHMGLSKEGEHASLESKGEKARRKAEEKRQARLEKEMLEEEERKQREEVARLIEERRKLRDIQLEADRERLKDSASDGSRVGSKEEFEKRRREKKKDRDRNSSKSNSDVEDHDNRGKKEAEKKRELERRIDHERPELCKIGVKPKSSDHIKGTSLFSSRSSNGWTFFGKNSQAAAILASKSSKPAFVQKRENSSAGILSLKPLPNGDFTKTSGSVVQHSVAPVINRTNAPKKAWHQLFARPSSHPQLPVEDIAEKLDQNEKSETKSSDSVDQTLSSNPSINQIPPSHTAGELGRNSGVEEAELFQDPCFVPDPISLIGPISESLDEFFSDPGPDFKDDILSDPSRIRKKSCDPSEIKKPSPIESPMSKLIGSGSSSPKSQDQGVLTESRYNDISEHGTWQMWSSSLCKDGVDLVGGPSSWLSALKPSRINDEIITRTPAEKNIVGKAMNDGILRPYPWDPSTGLHSFPQIKLPLEPLQEHYYPGDWSFPVGTGPLVRPPQQGRNKEQGGNIYGEWR